MSRLAPLDLSFFLMESPTRPMHAGGLLLFEPPADQAAGDFADRVVAAFKSTEPVSPFNLRADRPLLSPPRWEVVDEIDLGYHVRRIALPSPGSRAQLMELVSALYPTLLDRSLPLWECYVIEGLEGGALAVYYKIHHSLFDGASGARMIFRALSTSPDDGAPTPIWGENRRRQARKRAPRRVTPANPLRRVVQGIADIAGAGLRLASMVPQGLGITEAPGAVPFTAPRLSTSAQVAGIARSFAAFDLPLDEVVRAGKRAGGTVNDVALCVCAEAMNRYFAERGDVVDRPLVAAVAVSTRTEAAERASNQVATAHVSLGTPEATPAERLEQVVSSSRRAKEDIRRSSRGNLALTTMTILGAAELHDRVPIGRFIPHQANIFVSNVPGLAEPHYMGAGRLLGVYTTPIVPPAVSANFTCISCAGSLCFGVGAARSTLADAERLAELTVKSFEELTTRRKAPGPRQYA